MINIKDFEKEITKHLKRYSKVTSEEVQKAARDIAKEAVKDVQSKSPMSNTSRRGKYKEGWGAQKVEDGYVVRNKDEYRLTHLLEKCHVIRDGTGRKVGEAKPQVHIKPVEIEAIKNFEKRIDEIAKG